MAIKNVLMPWIASGAVLLGYTAFAWFRGRTRAPTAADQARRASAEVAPLSEALEHLPEEVALDSALSVAPQNTAPLRPADLGALFLGRATSAFSPFENEPQRASTAARKF